MKDVVTLLEHVGCTMSHFTLGGVRRCKNRDNNKWVQDYEVTEAKYYLLTPEEVEIIRQYREGTLQWSPTDTDATSSRPRSTTTGTTPAR